MSANPARTPAEHDERSALIAGIAAFGFWGIVPAYWKLMRAVPAPEILAHRVLWTTLFLLAVITWQRRWPDVRELTRSRRTSLFCLASGIAVSVNWLIFIWAVNANRVVETSLGYFMTPLVNVLLGAIFLRERLTRVQFASVLLATIAVINRTFAHGSFPWVALAVGSSFGLYGLLRKVSRTAAIPGLFLETVMLTPIAVGFLLFLQFGGRLFFGATNPSTSLLLVTTGIVTGLPLVWFGHAARHLRLTTVGFLQYLAPTGSFLLGVFVYREPFTRVDLITFVLIWIALAIFTAETVRRWRSNRNAAVARTRVRISSMQRRIAERKSWACDTPESLRSERDTGILPVRPADILPADSAVDPDSSGSNSARRTGENLCSDL